MTNETIARNYAATLFDLAQNHDGLDAFSQGMDVVVGLLDQNPKFKLFLETPRIADRDKKELLKKVFSPLLPRPLLNFLQVTVDKRRQRLLTAIGEEFHALLDEHFGRTHVTVTVARTLGEGAMADLSEKLSALLGSDAIPHVRVKPDILGGVQLRVGDTVYDGTLRRRIKQLRKQLVSAELPDSVFGASGS
ncbi:MAG: ATP synthase F1 subunit delta [Gemmatimonadetes bacterium]|nr:ATP synthase F1 subunit delta [Gemmatimonadota bacterium]NNM07245.1 ATP synthase F1 subunit delta [Gemmatimonadota bacterium]